MSDDVDIQIRYGGFGTLFLIWFVAIGLKLFGVLDLSWLLIISLPIWLPIAFISGVFLFIVGLVLGLILLALIMVLVVIPIIAIGLFIAKIMDA